MSECLLKTLYMQKQETLFKEKRNMLEYRIK